MANLIQSAKERVSEILQTAYERAAEKGHKQGMVARL